jgi:hypothetical protein
MPWLASLLVVSVVLCAPGPVSAQETAAPETSGLPSLEVPKTREDALRVLRTTDWFADVFIGFAGSPSAEACAFAMVMRQPDATQLFQTLIGRARKAGQMYALSGLYLRDRDLFAKEVVRYEGDTSYVRTMSGCLAGRVRVRELVHGESADHDDIASGDYPRRFAGFKGCTR